MKKNFLLFGFLLFHFCLSAQESNLLNNQATQELNQTTTAPVRSDLDKTLDEAEKVGIIHCRRAGRGGQATGEISQRTGYLSFAQWIG